MCILLVEDERLIRLIMAEELIEAGFDVEEAEHGDHAAMLISDHAHAFILLVTDIHMPGSRDGLEVARMLRERRSEVPIVYMTGRPDALNGRSDLGDKAVLLVKPFVPSRLVAAVQELLAEPGA